MTKMGVGCKRFQCNKCHDAATLSLSSKGAVKRTCIMRRWRHEESLWENIPLSIIHGYESSTMQKMVLIYKSGRSNL
jgi:hypothetical protein